MPPGSGQPTDAELLGDLTPAQQAAVTHFEGPLLVLAGAGSGKTRVITRRVAWLLRQGVRPWNILAITFTNKAAGEMRQRIEALVPNSRVWISTFHSLGARLMRQHADRMDIDKNFTIYDQDDRVRVVKQALEMADIDNSKFTPDRISGAISFAKNQLQTPDKFAHHAADYFALTVAKVYFKYEQRLREVNAVDFDDLLLRPALALRNDNELRAELDSRYRFVLIDEYQDTNAAQYEIAQRLSMDQPNICVVGDPDQSIYRWRGSDIKNILDFERDFPGAITIALERNYRSAPAILEAASSLIAHNKHRKPKDLVPTRPPGAPVRILTFDTGLDEADIVARRIKEAVRPFRDFAVFMRINALSRALESAFIREKIPYQIVRGLAFFERKENKDVLAYLRLLLNPRDDLSFLRIVNEPVRGIGATTLKHLRDYTGPRELPLLHACEQIGKIATIKAKAAKGLADFAAMMDELRGHLEGPPDEVIRQILDRTGYRKMLIDSQDPEDADRLANIEEMVTAARQFGDEDADRTVGDFLESITLASDVDGWDENSDRVSVMTLHASKGLEFPVVHILAVEQGLLPHERSLAKDEELEEERRLCFVGMTRAMEELYLCHAKLREFRGQALYAVPSPFLDELPENVERLDLSHPSGGRAPWMMPRRVSAHDEGLSAVKSADGFTPGVLIDHAMYGRGKILDVSGAGPLRRFRIRFEYNGEKVFVADKVKLTIIEPE
jgi:DNA helicase II / ATP-dependent DNA helicase PcrA